MADEHGGEEERENTRVVIVHDRQSACWGFCFAVLPSLSLSSLALSLAAVHVVIVAVVVGFC